MNNFKSTLARAAAAVAIVVLSGCASLEGSYASDDIVASMQASSQGGGE